MENVIAVVFKNESDGYQMITELRNAPKADMKAALKAKRQEREAELEKNFEEYKANLNL